LQHSLNPNTWATLTHHTQTCIRPICIWSWSVLITRLVCSWVWGWAKCETINTADAGRGTSSSSNEHQDPLSNSGRSMHWSGDELFHSGSVYDKWYQCHTNATVLDPRLVRRHIDNIEVYDTSVLGTMKHLSICGDLIFSFLFLSWRPVSLAVVQKLIQNAESSILSLCSYLYWRGSSEVITPLALYKIFAVLICPWSNPLYWMPDRI